VPMCKFQQIHINIDTAALRELLIQGKIISLY